MLSPFHPACDAPQDQHSSALPFPQAHLEVLILPVWCTILELSDPVTQPFLADDDLQGHNATDGMSSHDAVSPISRPPTQRH